MSVGASSVGFVGRQSELDQLAKAVSGAVAGQARLALVGGEAGVGKSRLFAEIATVAERAGFVVLTGFCVPLGLGALPYVPVTEALRRLAQLLDPETLRGIVGWGGSDIDVVVPELVEWGPRESDALHPRRVFELVLGILRRLSARTPILLGLEDLHWADQSTRDLISFLIRAMRSERLLVMGTFRTDEPSSDSLWRNWLAELTRFRNVMRLQLDRFDKPTTAQLLEALLGYPAPSGLTDDIYSRSGGNPFFAEELVVAHAAGLSGLPPSVLDVVQARIDALPAVHRPVLRAAAIMGHGIPYEQLRDLTDLPDEILIESLRVLVEAQVLVPDNSDESYAFRHALTREAVYRSLLPGERARLHGRLAAVLDDRGNSDPADLAELAFHWDAAGDSERALAAWVVAGLAAQQAAALAESGRHFERAIELWGAVAAPQPISPLTRSELVLHAAEVAGLSGHYPHAVELVRHAIHGMDEGGDPIGVGVMYQRLGEHLYNSGEDGHLAALQKALELIPAQPASSERAMTLATYGHILCRTGRRADAVAPCRAALDLACALEDRHVESYARCDLGSALIRLGDEESALNELHGGLRIALDASNIADAARAYSGLSSGLQVACRYEEGLQVALEGVAFCERNGMEFSYGSILHAQAAGALFALGRWDEADARVETSRELTTEDTLRDVEWPEFRVEQGRFESVHASIEPARRRAAPHDDVEHIVAELLKLPGHGGVVPGIIAALAGVAIWQGRPDQASALVAAALPAIPDEFLRLGGGLLFWRGVWARADQAQRARRHRSAAVAAECVRQAETLVEQIRHITHQPSPQGVHASHDLAGFLRLCEGELARAKGIPSTDRWRTAVEEWERLRHHPYYAAYARFRQAEAILTQRHNRAEAIDLLRQAHRTTIKLGAHPLRSDVERVAARARIELTAPSRSKSKDRSGLSARESEVLTLLVGGRTNRQIASELYISVKTVNTHVSNILTKLGAATRGEAAAIAHRDNLVPLISGSS